MTKRGNPNKRLVGVRDILAYLKEAHGIRVARTTLWRMSNRTGPSRFPAQIMAYLDGQRVIAESANVDAWVRVHALRPIK